jgi:hypothetical protein
MNNVAVRAHNINSNLVAFEVAPAAPTLAGSLATAQHAWPERAMWLRAAFERGDYRRTAVAPGVFAGWFFSGEAGEELAGL